MTIEIARLDAEDAKPHAVPFALKVLDLGRMDSEQIQAAITEWFTRWEPTHVVQAPSYIVGSQGEERLVLQAVDIVRWRVQVEQSGIAQARQHAAAQAEIQGLQSGHLRLATALDIPAAPPAPPAGTLKGKFRP